MNIEFTLDHDKFAKSNDNFQVDVSYTIPVIKRGNFKVEDYDELEQCFDKIYQVKNIKTILDTIIENREDHDIDPEIFKTYISAIMMNIEEMDSELVDNILYFIRELLHSYQKFIRAEIFNIMNSPNETTEFPDLTQPYVEEIEEDDHCQCEDSCEERIPDYEDSQEYPTEE